MHTCLKVGSFVDLKYVNFYAEHQNENKTYWKTKTRIIHKPLWLTSKSEQHFASTHNWHTYCSHTVYTVLTHVHRLSTKACLGIFSVRRLLHTVLLFFLYAVPLTITDTHLHTALLGRVDMHLVCFYSSFQFCFIWNRNHVICSIHHTQNPQRVLSL